MREILYKAHRMDNDEWVEGYYMPRLNSPNGKKHYIVTGDKTICYEIIHETLCQYTGLRDKTRTEKYPHGKKIWENDILRANFEKKYQNDITYCRVIWEDGAFRTLELGRTERDLLLKSDCEEFYETIGNFFDGIKNLFELKK